MSDDPRHDDETPGWAAPSGPPSGPPPQPPTDPWGSPIEPPATPPGPAPGGHGPAAGEPPGDWWGAPPGGGSGEPANPGIPPTGEWESQPPGTVPAAPYGQVPPVVGPPRTEPKAIWGLVLSIVGVLCAGGIGVILQPVALALAFLARKSIRESDGALEGDGLAMAAIVIGIVGFVLSVILVVAVLSNPDFFEQLGNG